MERESIYESFLQNFLVYYYIIDFIYMTPQIFINYKMKTVEYLNWKGMGYKVLNTIIDDFAVFVIKLPLLQIISAFRDDIIFLIFLYQMFIYRKKEGRGSKVKAN